MNTGTEHSYREKNDWLVLDGHFHLTQLRCNTKFPDTGSIYRHISPETIRPLFTRLLPGK